MMPSSSEQRPGPIEIPVTSERQSNVLAAHFKEYCGRLDENAQNLFSNESDLVFLEKLFQDAGRSKPLSFIVVILTIP